MNTPTIYIAGIDTDIGKTYATAYLLRRLREEGHKAISQKLVQTGCVGISEDIVKHRSLLREELYPEDLSGLTCPYLFSYPASPHLSARMDGQTIDPKRITDCTQELLQRGFDIVLVECAGGLMVPITEELLTADYIASTGAPIALVTSGRLGSLNHTLLSIEACCHRNISIRYLLYNTYPQQDASIEQETVAYLQKFVEKYLPECSFLQIPVFK